MSVHDPKMMAAVKHRSFHTWAIPEPHLKLHWKTSLDYQHQWAFQSERRSFLQLRNHLDNEDESRSRYVQGYISTWGQSNHSPNRSIDLKCFASTGYQLQLFSAINIIIAEPSHHSKSFPDSLVLAQAIMKGISWSVANSFLFLSSRTDHAVLLSGPLKTLVIMMALVLWSRDEMLQSFRGHDVPHSVTTELSRPEPTIQEWGNKIFHSHLSNQVADGFADVLQSVLRWFINRFILQGTKDVCEVKRRASEPRSPPSETTR